MRIGILCGHPIKNLFENGEDVTVDTPYGSVFMSVGAVGSHELFSINRHGKEANIPPQRISYRANIQALSSSNVECVISIGTVGSMNINISPGDFVVPHDFFDMTCCRDKTFFETKRVHVDMTDPFCPTLRKHLISACERNDLTTVHKQGIYIATQGPRLESATEVRFFASIGDIVGMTLIPEVVLAREKGLCFASLCVVCNMAAGIQKNLPVDEIKKIYVDQEPFIAETIRHTLGVLSTKKVCECGKKIGKAFL
jgi:5'-methylthioadenosine phosphorylase